MIRSYLFVAAVASVCVDTFIKEPECKQCKLYREILERYIDEKDYLQQVLLTATGVISKTAEEKATMEDMRPMPSRTMSLSHLRSQAEAASKRKAYKLANPIDLTEAERLFEKELSNDKV